MKFQVTNMTAGPRLIFHAGEGNTTGGTIVAKGASQVIDMTKAEAENAACDGLKIIEESDAPAPEQRAFLATSDSPAGDDFRPLDLAGAPYIGIAMCASAPTRAGDYQWMPVTQPVRHEPPVFDQPSALSSAAGTAAGATGADTSGGDGGGGSDDDLGQTLKAMHRGAGSYSVMRGDEEVVEKLNKAEAAEFNALTAEDQAAWIELRTGA